MTTHEDFYDVTVSALASDGRGVARPDNGPVLFVEGALPGQRVRVRVTSVKPRLLEGEVAEVLAPSPHERPAACSHDACGGCPWQCLDYAEQCRWKSRVLYDALKRLGGLCVDESLPFLPSPQEWGYRNKMAFVAGTQGDGVVVGQKARRSHQIVPLTDCRMQDAVTMRVLAALSAALRPEDAARFVVVRRPRAGGLRVEVIVGPEATWKKHGQRLAAVLREAVPECTGFALSLRTTKTDVAQGEKRLGSEGESENVEVLHRPDGSSLRLTYNDRSFLQVNTAAAECLYAEGLRLLDLPAAPRPVRLWDIYGGVGSIGLFMAPYVAEVRGVESVPAAVTMAQRNATDNGFDHCHFEAGDAAAVFGGKDVKPSEGMDDVVVLDPPRAGVDKQVLESVLRLNPAQLLYISCNPATLARDAALLAKKYAIQAVHGVDMFPQTEHVEGIVLFRRAE